MRPCEGSAPSNSSPAGTPHCFGPNTQPAECVPLPIAENVGFARFEQLSTASEQFGKHLQSLCFLV
jgi:hypothetical protein